MVARALAALPLMYKNARLPPLRYFEFCSAPSMPPLYLDCCIDVYAFASQPEAALERDDELEIDAGMVERLLLTAATFWLADVSQLDDVLEMVVIDPGRFFRTQL